MTVQATTLETSDGLSLEAAWSQPRDDALGVVVLCHPHPTQGGTMDAPLLRSVAGRLTDAGFRVLRFNFRGVGQSEGAWGGGDPEILDVGAAVEHARAAYPALPFHLAGWSFGAVTALRWQAETGDASPYAGIAPALEYEGRATMPDPATVPPASRLMILGDRDQYCTPDALTEYAAAIGATVEVIPACDHFFVFRDVQVGRRIAEHFLGKPLADS